MQTNAGQDSRNVEKFKNGLRTGIVHGLANRAGYYAMDQLKQSLTQFSDMDVVDSDSNRTLSGSELADFIVKRLPGDAITHYYFSAHDTEAYAKLGHIVGQVLTEGLDITVKDGTPKVSFNSFALLNCRLLSFIPVVAEEITNPTRLENEELNEFIKKTSLR